MVSIIFGLFIPLITGVGAVALNLILQGIKDKSYMGVGLGVMGTVVFVLLCISTFVCYYMIIH